MKLLSPTGVRVSVSDSTGELLKLQGWKEPAKAPSVPAKTPVRRTRRKKTD